MKEIIFLSFGNNSNYVLSHFFNLNDEILKDKSNPLNLNHFSIFNDNYKPRTILFDYSPNIQKYYTLNEKVEQDEINEIKSKYDKDKLEIYQNDLTQNNFLSMMSELNLIDTSNIDDEDKDNNEEDEEDEDDFNNNKNNYYSYKYKFLNNKKIKIKMIIVKQSLKKRCRKN